MGNKVVSIFFDIDSAFDKVWHEGLSYKLAEIKIPYYIIKIIENLMFGRVFKVKVGSFTTENRKIEVGLAQGAVLSLTLFSIYINDVPIENTPHTSYTLLFADDIVHYVIYEKKYEELEKTINLYLSHLENWMNKWRLSLAPHKCSYTIFTKNKRLNNEIGFDLKLYGISIPRDNAPVFLGLRFDPFMSWTNHMDHVIKKAK